MHVVNPADQRLFTDDHPTGALGQRYLLQGTDGDRENFMLAIAENLGHFAMVRHRHNFDQFRFALSGDMTMGRNGTLREGHLGYFPEGTSYGPQDDGPGPIALVLQLGGASGSGYMSPGQYRDGRAALNEIGHFDGPVFVRDLPDGTTKKTFSINAIWEQSIGERLVLPAPRYDTPVFMNPKAYRWIPVAGRPGVFRKHLGTFSEREVMAETLLLKPGATLDLGPDEAAYRLYFVLDGAGQAGGAGGADLGRHFAAQADPGQGVSLRATEQLTLLGFRLPLVAADWADPELPGFEPLPNEAVPDEAVPGAAEPAESLR
ncbi:hypothetical protein GCM10022254_30200 [Actinomadura meridiana]|uniref:Quercetin 2,3-dioxygenase n=1 Tax=Actinomadura meridiana TaxID=559626 RepID=A0ABP8C193_9ACTN